MFKKTKWKIAMAVLAIVAAGIVYCVFFTEEKEGTVLYQFGATNEETAGDSSAKDPVNPKAQTGVNAFEFLVADQVAKQEVTDVSKNSETPIYVHVCGAVKNPGVYALVKNSRVYDAIAMAGGLTEAAADDYVNQARYLSDGERVYIPQKEELSNLSSSQYAAGQPVADGQSGDSEQENLPVNINTAGISELTTLPGIGESRAESIIAYREQHGFFTRIEDIMKISGIKGAAYEKIKDRICTGNE